jgi:hypothetical protein
MKKAIWNVLFTFALILSVLAAAHAQSATDKTPIQKEAANVNTA